MTEHQTINLPIRKVQRAIAHPYDGTSLYYVIEQTPEGGWKHVSKGYAHSTSAFAALGRLVQKDTLGK